MLPSSVCWRQNAMHHIDGASIDWRLLQCLMSSSWHSGTWELDQWEGSIGSHDGWSTNENRGSAGQHSSCCSATWWHCRPSVNMHQLWTRSSHFNKLAPEFQIALNIRYCVAYRLYSDTKTPLARRGTKAIAVRKTDTYRTGLFNVYLNTDS